MAENFAGVDLYIRTTDGESGKKSVSHHRAWNPNALIESLNKEAMKKGGSVEQITDDQYKKERAK